MKSSFEGLIQRTTRVLFVIGLLGVVVLSLMPHTALPPTGIWDKAGHSVAYAILAVCGALGFRGHKWLMVVGAGLVLLGGALELAQAGIPGRFGSVGDAIANAVGVVLGLLAVHCGRLLANRLRASP